MVDSWVLPVIAELTSSDIAEQIKASGAQSAWEEALRLRLVSDDALLAALSKKLRTPVAMSLAVADDAKALIPERIARKYHIVPLNASPHTLDVATANPWDLDAER